MNNSIIESVLSQKCLGRDAGTTVDNFTGALRVHNEGAAERV